MWHLYCIRKYQFVTESLSNTVFNFYQFYYFLLSIFLPPIITFLCFCGDGRIKSFIYVLVILWTIATRVYLVRRVWRYQRANGLWTICVTNYHGYVPLDVNTSRPFPSSWPITGYVTRFTRRLLPVEKERLTLPEHMDSPPVFSGVRASRSLVLYVYFVDRCLSFCPFSFGHCVVFSSSIYGLLTKSWWRP